MAILDDAGLALLFTEAHTHNAWQPKAVEDALLRRVYELARLPPTAANSQPMRLLFVKTTEAKERLRPTLSPGNVEKTMAAPVTAIVAYDMTFYEKMPRLYPQTDMRSGFVKMTPERRERHLMQNGSLGGAYVILAARALGLDCGPMGGFDNAKVDAAFFPDGAWKSNFLVNLGYGDPNGVRPRNPRFDFDEACRIA